MLFRYMQRNPGAGAEDAERLARLWGVMPATAAILIGRGVNTPEAGQRFFGSGLESIRDPMNLMDMDRAVGRIRAAIDDREHIVVYGDYDVDGVCATSILVEYLRGQGADCEYYIPSRHTEGYGLNRAAIESLRGAKLLITVDCGISNAAEVALARSLGMDVIVTDHHECPEELPQCLAVVNPKRPGQDYGFAGLCGAGVALQLVHALGGIGAAEAALDLVALATVADIVPLADENLAIVRMGILKINEGARPGVAALKKAAGLAGKPVKSGNIGFALAPRINAGGRMDLSRKSVEMMLTDDAECALAIAQELDDDNSERMKVEEGILEEAIGMIERGYSFAGRRAIVLYQPHWNTGVTGIVASRIVERYSRPTILFGAGEGACYGSGRSIPGVHLYRAMSACSQYFLRFGGHEQAAGCALTEENLEPFASALDGYLAQTYGQDVFLPSRYYDAELSLRDFSIGLARDMEKLEPSGFGNPRPVFLLKDVELSGVVRTKDEKHLRLRFGQGGIEGIAFRQGAQYEMLERCDRCDALVVPDVNDWMGRERVQAVVEHVRLPQGLAQARTVLAGAGSALCRSLSRACVAEPFAASSAPLPMAEGLERLRQAVERSCWGTLALFFTAHSAGAALDALQSAGLLGRVYVAEGRPHQAGRRENALVLAPDLERLPLAGCETLFIFDGAFASNAALRAASALNNGINCIIMDDTGDEGLAGQFHREELLKVYRAMRRALAEGHGPRSRGDWEWLAESDGIPALNAELSARIFAELGLLRELDKRPWLAAENLPGGRAELMNSAIYRKLKELAEV